MSPTVLLIQKVKSHTKALVSHKFSRVLQARVSYLI
jgi:hypothetical protein